MSFQIVAILLAKPLDINLDIHYNIINEEMKITKEIKTMTTATQQYRLSKIYDVREYDAWQREYLPCSEEEKNVCENCGRKHVKVYVVEEVVEGTETGHLLYVGSSCCQKYLHWEPSKEEIKQATAQIAQEKKVAQKKAIEDKATDLVNELRSRLPGRNNPWDLKVSVAEDIINSYDLNETQKSKVWNIAKKSF